MRRAALLLAVLLLASCSDGGSDPSPSTAASGPVAATTTVAPTFSGAGSERFCALARTAWARQGELATVAPSADAVRDQVTEAADATRAMVAVAPAEIAADVRVIAGAYDALLERLRRAAFDPSVLASATADAFGAPAVQTAGQRLTAYQRTVCGIAG